MNSPYDESILADLAPGERSISIVDVGAAFFGEKQLYRPLLDRNLGRLTSFEPDAAKFDELNRMAKAGDRDVILNYALGDGNTHALHLAAGGMTSLFEPDQASYDLFTLFSKPPFSPVQAAGNPQAVPTTRLDDIAGLDRIDVLKIDVQGSELMILQNGRKKLSDCSILQVEVPFVCLYKGQPTFGDIDAELRAQGFMVHGFATLKRLPMHPYKVQGPLTGINQLIDLDMVYIRDCRRMQMISTNVLRKTAIVADLCYGSFDLTLRCLTELSRRRVIPKDTPDRYVGSASHRSRVSYIHHTPCVQ